jgi:hypothetical protein
LPEGIVGRLIRAVEHLSEKEISPSSMLSGPLIEDVMNETIEAVVFRRLDGISFGVTTG